MANEKKQEINNYETLKAKIDELLAKSPCHFKKYVNTREYELAFSGLAGKVDFNSEFIAQVENEINSAEDKCFAFTLFFVLYTWIRRNHYGSLTDFFDKYDDRFKEFKIIKHLEYLTVLSTSNNPKELKQAIKNIYKLINEKTDEADFSENVGVLNNYVELVCTYCELKFDERGDKEIDELLQQALEYNEFTIKSEEKTKQNAYPKFYLNRGRILVMLKQYNEGEDQIKYAISLLPVSADRSMQVNDYSQYLAKSSMMRAYDKNSEKFEELDRFKVDSYKTVTLIMAVIGFLLGTINIFSKVEEPFTLLMLMLGYCGLVMMLAGVVLLGFALNFKERKKRFLIFDAFLAVAGIALFVVPLVIILVK